MRYINYYFLLFLISCGIQSCEIAPDQQTITPIVSDQQVVYQGLAFWLPKQVPAAALELSTQAVEKQLMALPQAPTLAYLAEISKSIADKYPNDYRNASSINRINQFLVENTWETLGTKEQEVVRNYFKQVQTYELVQELTTKTIPAPKDALNTGLTSCELALLGTDVLLIQVVQNSVDAARAATEEFYVYSNVAGDQSDAFRHSTWNLMMMYNLYWLESARLPLVSEAVILDRVRNFVKDFTDAHEICADNYSDGSVPHLLDLHNNAIGRQLFEDTYTEDIFTSNGSLWLEFRKTDLRAKANNQAVIVGVASDFDFISASTLTIMHRNFYPNEILLANNAWAKYEIQFMLLNPGASQAQAVHFMSGYSDGTFRPKRAVTRAEFATMIAKIMQLPTTTTANFNDIAGHWAATNIRIAASAGYLSGYPDGSFKPDNLLTKAEMLVAVASGLNLPTASTAILNNYQDANQIPTWARPAIANATAVKIVPNYPVVTQLEPTRNARRDEAVVLLAQARRHNNMNWPRNINPYVVNF